MLFYYSSKILNFNHLYQQWVQSKWSGGLHSLGQVSQSVMFFPMLMMTIEVSLMSQGFYSGSSAFQFVSSGKLGWVTSERLNCVNWPLLVFKAWTCNNMNGVSKGSCVTFLVIQNLHKVLQYFLRIIAPKNGQTWPSRFIYYLFHSISWCSRWKKWLVE